MITIALSQINAPSHSHPHSHSHPNHGQSQTVSSPSLEASTVSSSKVSSKDGKIKIKLEHTVETQFKPKQGPLFSSSDDINRSTQSLSAKSNQKTKGSCSSSSSLSTSESTSGLKGKGTGTGKAAGKGCPNESLFDPNQSQSQNPLNLLFQRHSHIGHMKSLTSVIHKSKKTVLIAGAGISTSAGIPVR
jgi:hypothetical protein